MSACYVCSTSLEGYDEAAANHHINLCLDGSGPSTSVAGNASTDIAFQAKQDNDVCPVCDVKISSDEKLEEHVQACILSLDGDGQNGSHVNEGADICPSCLMDWSDMGALYDEDKQTHVADCLAQQRALSEDEDDLEVVDENGNKLSSSQLKTLLSNNGLSNGFGKLASAVKGKSRQQDNITSNLIPQLVLLLEKAFSSSRSSTRSAVLCTSNVQHVKSQWGDFGWGCGYRNAQMVFSALRHVEQYRSLFGDTSAESSSSSHGKRKTPDGEEYEVADLPAIAELQELAEKAWNAGFDPLGKKHFKGKLVSSKRWIGTSEVYVMFSWLGIRATVIDFPKATGPQSTHTALAKWVFDYFQADLPDRDESNGEEKGKNAFNVLMASNGSCVKIMEDKMPLYLQHQGHSRTIVGAETTKKGELNLLLFDPGKKIPQELRSLANSSANKKAKTMTPSTQPVDLKHLDIFRVNLKSLSRQKEYQILRIETHGGPLTADEKLERRIIRSLEVK